MVVVFRPSVLILCFGTSLHDGNASLGGPQTASLSQPRPFGRANRLAYQLVSAMHYQHGFHFDAYSLGSFFSSVHESKNFLLKSA